MDFVPKNEQIKDIYENKIIPLLSHYSRKDRKYIKKYFYSFIGDYDAPVILMQLYSEFGIISPENDRYNRYVEDIERIFGLERTILDVAEGHIPSFANKVAQKQLNCSRGTIRVIDPKIVIKKARYKTMKIERRKFTLRKKAQSCDLLVAIFPCNATKKVLKYAYTHKIDFYIPLCPCTYYKNKRKFPGKIFTHKEITEMYLKKYLTNIRKKLVEAGLGTLEISYLNNGVSPIIYNRR